MLKFVAARLTPESHFVLAAVGLGDQVADGTPISSLTVWPTVPATAWLSLLRVRQRPKW
jgi:hypothetical protein